MRVFADAAIHAAASTTSSRAARTSHGTFYLYFTNKEDLLRALAIDSADDLTALADHIGPITPDEQASTSCAPSSLSSWAHTAATAR